MTRSVAPGLIPCSAKRCSTNCALVVPPVTNPQVKTPPDDAKSRFMDTVGGASSTFSPRQSYDCSSAIPEIVRWGSAPRRRSSWATLQLPFKHAQNTGGGKRAPDVTSSSGLLSSPGRSTSAPATAACLDISDAAGCGIQCAHGDPLLLPCMSERWVTWVKLRGVKFTDMLLLVLASPTDTP